MFYTDDNYVAYAQTASNQPLFHGLVVRLLLISECPAMPLALSSLIIGLITITFIAVSISYIPLWRGVAWL